MKKLHKLISGLSRREKALCLSLGGVIISAAVLLAVWLLLRGQPAVAGSSSDIQAPPEDPPVSSMPVKMVKNPFSGLYYDDPAQIHNRSAAIMVSNISLALPQYGLQKADIIYEVVTEGGITRLLACFGDMTTVPRIGPVRSSRDYFIDLAQGLGAVYIHWGGSDIAYNVLSQRRVESLDGIAYSGTAFFRDEELARTKGVEHSGFTSYEYFKNGLAAKKIPMTTDQTPAPAFRFVEPGSEYTPGEIAAPSVAVPMSGYVTARFAYDQTRKVYLKSEFGKPEIDALTGEQLNFKNVLVLYADQGNLTGDNANLLYVKWTKGDGYYISQGGAVPIQWEKGNPTEPIKCKTAEGVALNVNSGNTWVCIAPPSAKKNTKFE